MNKKQATKWALSKDNPNHEKNKLQGGWTEKEAAEAMAAAGLGLSRDDFSDDGADLQELKEIVEGN